MGCGTILVLLVIGCCIWGSFFGDDRDTNKPPPTFPGPPATQTTRPVGTDDGASSAAVRVDSAADGKHLFRLRASAPPGVSGNPRRVIGRAVVTTGAVVRQDEVNAVLGEGEEGQWPCRADRLQFFIRANAGPPLKVWLERDGRTVDERTLDANGSVLGG